MKINSLIYYELSNDFFSYSSFFSLLWHRANQDPQTVLPVSRVKNGFVVPILFLFSPLSLTLLFFQFSSPRDNHNQPEYFFLSYISFKNLLRSYTIHFYTIFKINSKWFFFSIFKLYYWCSITVVWILSPPLYLKLS